MTKFVAYYLKSAKYLSFETMSFSLYKTQNEIPRVLESSIFLNIILRYINAVKRKHIGLMKRRKPCYTQISKWYSEIFKKNCSYLIILEFPSGSKKGKGVENKKRALLMVLRAHFWFPKALLNLKVCNIFNM